MLILWAVLVYIFWEMLKLLWHSGPFSLDPLLTMALAAGQAQENELMHAVHARIARRYAYLDSCL